MIPGLLVLPIIGWIADTWTIRVGHARAGAAVHHRQRSSCAASADVIDADIAQVWQSAAARCEALYQRRQGRPTCCWCAASTPATTSGQVLFGVDLDVTGRRDRRPARHERRRQVTLLKAISGVVEADRGAVVLDGRDITHAPPNEIAALGIVQMPGGKGVFGSLTVSENLDSPAGRNRRDPAGVKAAIAEVARDVPDPARATRRRRRQTCAAASSRCSPWRWLHHAGRRCC